MSSHSPGQSSTPSVNSSQGVIKLHTSCLFWAASKTRKSHGYILPWREGTHLDQIDAWKPWATEPRREGGGEVLRSTPGTLGGGEGSPASGVRFPKTLNFRGTRRLLGSLAQPTERQFHSVWWFFCRTTRPCVCPVCALCVPRQHSSRPLPLQQQGDTGHPCPKNPPGSRLRTGCRGYGMSRGILSPPSWASGPQGGAQKTSRGKRQVAGVQRAEN